MFAVSSITFNGDGDNTVHKSARYRKYEPNEQRVYINKTQYFAPVPPEDYEFHIGGYQVLEKRLKDRRGRALTGDDITHYKRVVLAIQHTRRLMTEIDAAIGDFLLP